MRKLLSICCCVLLAIGLQASRPPVLEGGALTATAVAAADLLYAECGLAGSVDPVAFRAAYGSLVGRHNRAKVLAVADMSRPSTEKRLHIIDLQARRLLLSTWVAHGKNSGDLYCERVSNRKGSLQTSKGLYRVGDEIVSPKHGRAMLLHGLNRGVNDNALDREIIIHGADYVSESFIAEHGRLGRSYGCPAVARDLIDQVVDLLTTGALLYVYQR